MEKFRRLFGMLAAVGVMTGMAHAGVIYTTGTNGNNSDPVYNSSSSAAAVIQHQGSGNHWSVATPFSVASDATLTGLSVPLSRFAATGPFSSGDLVDFYITISNGQYPNTDALGNILQNGTGFLDHARVTPIPGNNPAIFTVSFDSGATLTGGVNYWLLANMPGVNPGPTFSGQLVDIWYTNSDSTTSNGTMTNHGTAWALSDGTKVAFTLLGDTAETGTPEPGTLALLAGGAGLLVLRKFRQR